MSPHLRSLFLAGLLAAATPAAVPPVALVDALGDPLPPGALARHGTVRLRHNGAHMLTFTADGKRLVSYGGVMVQEFRLWDTDTGKLLHRRRLHGMEAAEQVAVSPDGGVFFVGAAGVFHIKDLKSPKKKLHEEMDFNPMFAQASPDGKRLAVGTLEGGLVLDVASGKVLFKLDAGGGMMPIDGGRSPDLAFSPDGRLLAMAANTGEVVLWDAVNGKKLHAYPAPPMNANPPDHAVAGWSFSPDGRFLLATTHGRLRVLETAGPRDLAGFTPPNDPLIQVRFSDDGKQLVAVDQTGNLRRYDAATGKDVSTTPLPIPGRETAHQAFFSPDRKSVAVVENSNIHIIDLKTNKSRHPHLGDREALGVVRWSPAGPVVSLSSGNRVRVWDPKTGKTLRTDALAEGEMILDVDRDGRHVLTQTPEQPPRVVRLADKQELWKAEELAMGQGGLTFSPDGRWVVTKSGAGVEVREARTGKVRRTWPTADEALAMPSVTAWSADGRMVALADGMSDRVTIHEFATGKTREVIEADHPVVEAAFCPRGLHLALGRTDGLVRVYRLGQAKPLFEVVVRITHGGGIADVGLGGLAPGAVAALPILGGGVPKLAFSPDGRLLAAACAADVRVWDLTGRPAGVFRGHDDGVLDVAFSPDGRTLVSSSADGTALVWDMSHLKQPRVSPPEPVAEESLWADLASDDAGRAYRAMARLRERPGVALKLFAAKLSPTTAAPPKAVLKLLDDLEADTAAARRDAAAGLEALDVQAEPELRKAAEATRSAEVRRAVTRLLAKIDGAATVPDRVREVRAVEVLETVGDAKARALLEVLAKGADSRLTREAKEALARLASRP